MAHCLGEGHSEQYAPSSHCTPQLPHFHSPAALQTSNYPWFIVSTCMYHFFFSFFFFPVADLSCCVVGSDEATWTEPRNRREPPLTTFPRRAWPSSAHRSFPAQRFTPWLGVCGKENEFRALQICGKGFEMLCVSLIPSNICRITGFCPDLPQLVNMDGGWMLVFPPEEMNIAVLFLLCL